MTTSKSNAAYDTLISLRNKLTHLNGVITPEAVNKLEDELGGIFTVTKTHHYKQGQKYGHLASAVPKQKVQTRHQKRNIGTHSAGRSRHVLVGSSRCRQLSPPPRTTCGGAQDPPEELQ